MGITVFILCNIVLCEHLKYHLNLLVSNIFRPKLWLWQKSLAEKSIYFHPQQHRQISRSVLWLHIAVSISFAFVIASGYFNQLCTYPQFCGGFLCYGTLRILIVKKGFVWMYPKHKLFGVYLVEWMVIYITYIELHGILFFVPS